MKKNFIPVLLAGSLLLTLAACNSEDKEPAAPAAKTPSYKEQTVDYTDGKTSMKGFVVFDENKEGTRPAVLVIHEWWGLNDYARMRAKELAKLGYIAMAVDMYGNGKIADNPDSAGKLAAPFYSDPQMTKARFDAALVQLKTYAQTDTSQIAAIGYCFGGAQVLNLARLGEDLKGVVSFHGNLLGVPLDKSKLKASILVCHGAADPFVPVGEVEKFRKEMDSAQISFTFKSYPDATHAFTNPDATAMGEKFKIPIAYNAAADTASWNDMKTFFGTIFK